MTQPEFLRIMAYLEAGSGSGRPVTEMQAEVYWDFLKDLPAATVKRAATQALAESQFPTIPPVGVLLRLAGQVSADIKPDSRALLAYSEASRAVQSQGGYSSVDFEDPLVNAAIRSMGGWQRFCDWPCDEVQWRQRDFERHYQALLQAGASGDLAAHLPGFCETVNGGLGYDEHIDRPVGIGTELPPHRRGIIHGEVPQPQRLCSDPEVRKLIDSIGRLPSESIEKPDHPEMTEAEFETRKTKGIADLRNAIDSGKFANVEAQ